MPSRSLCLAIVVFWMAMMTWLFRRDVWPRLAPGEPPPFTVDFADEKQDTRLPTRWIARQTSTGKPDHPTPYTVTTLTTYDDRRRVYELIARTEPRYSEPDTLLPSHRLKRLTSAYRVTEKGELLGFHVKVDARGPSKLAGDPHGDFTGLIVDGTCVLSWEQQGGGRAHGEERFEVSRTGTVLLPLHPLYRMRGLKPGKHWGVRLFDPLASTLARPRTVWVNARVRPQTEPLRWNGREQLCLVVEYEGDNVRGVTWVDTRDDRVLKLRVHLGEDVWEIVRE